MAVSVDTVYQTVLALANKEQRGYITPQEFNLFANQAQNEILEQYFYDINQFGRALSNNTEYSNMVSLLHEKLSPLKVTDEELTMTSNYGTLPNTVYKLGTVSAEDGAVLDEVNRKELKQMLLTPLTTPSDDRPVFFLERKGIYVYPTTLKPILIEYIKKPTKVKWGFVIVGERALYDPAKSSDFGLHSSEQAELVYKILGLAGVTLNRQDISGAAMAMEKNKVQQEKQ